MPTRIRRSWFTLVLGSIRCPLLFYRRHQRGRPIMGRHYRRRESVGRTPHWFLNPKLYLLGALGGQSAFFHDITVGNNSFAGVPGYAATRGWDPVTGWG